MRRRRLRLHAGDQPAPASPCGSAHRPGRRRAGRVAGRHVRAARSPPAALPAALAVDVLVRVPALRLRRAALGDTGGLRPSLPRTVGGGATPLRHGLYAVSRFAPPAALHHMRSRMAWVCQVAVTVVALSCGDGGTEAQRRGVGAACAMADDCTETGQSCLTQFKGGYCGVASCTADEECPPGSACVTHDDGMNYCFLICIVKTDC